MYSYMSEEKVTGNGNQHSIIDPIMITNSMLKIIPLLLVAILLHTDSPKNFLVQSSR
jgi:hypothetical protein